MSERSANTRMNGKTMSNTNGGSKSMGSLSAKLAAVLALACAALALGAATAGAAKYQPVNEINMLGIAENWETKGAGYARGLAVDPGTHDIFLAVMLGEGRLHKWDAAENETVFGREEFFGYFGVTVDPEKHDVFALNVSTKRVEHYLPSLKKATPTFFQTEANGMIVTGPEGHIFIAHSPGIFGVPFFPGGEGGAIEEYNRAGELLQAVECGSCPGTPYFGPVGEALDAAGNLYVADKQNNRVIKMERAGASYVNPTVFSTGPSSSVAVDRASGRVFVGGDEPPAPGSEEPGPFYVTAYDSGGNELDEFGKGFIEDPFANLGGGAQITVDQGTGHVFVSSTHANREPCCKEEPRVYEFADMVPAIVEPEPATVEASRHVTLNAAVNPNGTLVLNCHFEYGPTTAYGQSAPCSPDPGFEREPVAVSAEIAGLQPDATYHFRVVVTNEGGTTEGADGQFTTLIDKPVVTTGGASELNSFGATISGSVNPLSNPVTACRFEYGAGTDYGNVVPCPGDPGTGSSPVAEAVALTGLTPSTTYHYRLVAANDGGTESGADATFTTLSHTPKAITGGATNVVADGAKLSGTLNPEGSVTNWRFEYGPTTTYGETSPLVSAVGSEDQKVTAILGSLVPTTTYHYRLVASNAGGTTRGADQVLTTGPRPVGRIYIPAKAPLQGHTAAVSLQCRGVAIAECKGTLTLRARIEKGIRFILVKVGSGDFDFFGGKSQVVKITLNDAGRKALSQSEGKPLPAVASATGKNRVVRLEKSSSAKRHKRHGHR
jgi:hypothetical protein